MGDEKQAKREAALLRLKTEFPLYAHECLKIKNKQGATLPLNLNRIQNHLHGRLEAQKQRIGMVRVLIGKGRQGGVSTYIGGRFYHATSLNRGIETYILTHEQDATDTLFAMVERFHQYTPLKPAVGASNAKELRFAKLDSGYSVGTAGNIATGRSKTIQRFHGSEVAHWKNAADHFAGVVQTVPRLPGTEIILESTGHGIGNEFHSRWMQAEAGFGDYQTIFLPWFWTEEYVQEPDPGFALSDEEIEHARLFDLTLPQVAWRRSKMAELRDPLLFKQEYPACANDMWEGGGRDAFIPVSDVLRARKATLEGIGPLVIGVDPSRFGDDRFSVAWRRGRKILKVESRVHLDTMQAIGWLKNIIDVDKPAKMFIDTGGGGDRIYDVMVSYGPPYDKILELIAFGGSPQEGIRYLADGTRRAGPKNRRAEMWERSKEWLAQTGGADIPDSDSLQQDACAPGYHYDAVTQQLILESKEHMMARKIPSPDEWDAVALTFAAPVAEPKSQPKKAVVSTIQPGPNAWMAN